MVSIIIPTHKGAEEQTRRCVQSVKRSTYKDIEIIVVDEGLERSAQRNIGIDKSKGEYLLILDSDTEIHDLLIADCVCRMTYADAIYIPEIIMTPGWFGRLRNWERQFYTGTAVDVVRFVRAYGCPRFDENMSGPEDSDWDRRIEGVRRTSNWALYHYDNIGVMDYFRKKAYYTKSMRHFAEKWPNDPVLNFKWRCWTVFTENEKWKTLLRHVPFTVCLCLLLFVRGLIYLCAKKS